MNQTCDVIIIGGGIIGASCAYYLCNAGLQVILVERKFPASGTSRACDGLILLWDKQPGTELHLGRASLKLWHQLAETLDKDFDFSKSGTLFLADNEEALESGRQKASVIRSEGLQAQLLDPQELCKLEPNLAPDLAGGVYFPDDLQVDPRNATLALLRAAEANGLQIHSDEEVIALTRTEGENGRICGVRTQKGNIAAKAVVCATGVWSSTVIKQSLGLDLPIKPRKGHILVTSKSEGMIKHPLLEGGYAASVMSTDADAQIALVAEKTSSGSILLGSSRQFSGYNRQVSIEIMCAIASRAMRFLPKLAEVNIVRCYTGLRPWSEDHLPLIGPMVQTPGLYLATGHEGAGICMAPITGKLINDWITDAIESAISDYTKLASQVTPQRFNL